MRVIRCPNCDEPLPGLANFCAICGETLIPSPKRTTTKLSMRPRSLKVSHFFALGSDTQETVPFKKLSSGSSETVKLVQRPSRLGRYNTISPTPLKDVESGVGSPAGNWHKIVDSRPRTPTVSRTSIPAPRMPLPLPPEYLLTANPPLRPQRRQPSIFFWLSVLMLLAVLLGGLVGLVLSLGHGALAQKLSHANEITLQVTPVNVALGNVITLRGSNFSPHGHIGLTRDTTIPVIDTEGNTIIQTDGKGSFADTVTVEAEWQAGSHLIRAEDAIMHKSATFTIVVTGHSPSLRPPHLLLSSGSIDLGTGDQATNSTKTITLTNGGGGQISWQSAATQSWLLLSPKNGTFSNGQSIRVRIAANRSNLQPGGYAAQIIFTSNAGQIMLPVKMKTTPLDPGHEAVLQLTPSVLSFTGVDGGNNPPVQILTVSNPGVLPLQWSASTSSDWLSITPTSSDVSKGNSQAVEIGVNSSLQLPGTYSGVVRFASRQLAPTKNSPQNVYVSLTIVPQCALQVMPGVLSFTGVYLQPGPAARTINVNAAQACNTPLRWNAIATTNNGEHWLRIGNTSGTTPSLPAVSIDVEGLKPGIYSGFIIFGWSTGTQTMPVTFIMGQPTAPILLTSPALMTFSGIIGQPGLPGQAITVTNSGGGTLNWQASAATNFGGAWLFVAPAAGTLASHQSKTVNVTVIMLNNLIPNTYTGMVTITGTDASGHPVPGSPQNIPVNFIVLAPCTIAGTPSALSFAGVVGQPEPPVQPATITASGTCTHLLHWTASTGNAAWLTATPSSGNVDINSTATTNIGILLAGLGVNTYTGHVTITAIDSVTHKSVGTPQVITVTLTVQPTCTLQTASISQANFSAEVGTNPHPANRSFTIGITGACQGSITITPIVAQNWLTVSPSSAVIMGGSTPFTVTVTSASLVAGGYNGVVSIAAVDSKGITITGSPQTVSVALTVLAAPSLTVNQALNGLTINVTSGTTSQAISINNTGGEPLNWTAALGSSAPSFVSLSTSAGSNLLGGASTTDNVIVTASGVPGGTSYTTSLTISAIDPITGNIVAGSPTTIPITINIAPPVMQLDTSTLAYTTSVSVNPQAQSVNITNSGGDGLSWSAGLPSQPWLTLGLNKGSNNYQQTSTIPFNIDVTGMSSGSYTATIIVTPSVGAAQMVTVTLIIT